MAEDLPPAAEQASEPLEACPPILDLLEAEGLVERCVDDGAEPFDITQEPPSYPPSRSTRLQMLARADEGWLLALSYSTQRGYGRNHPFAAEIRSGALEVEIFAEELGMAVCIGEIQLTECQMLNQFIGSREAPPQFTRSYGLTFGRNERRSMAMALVDRSLRAAELGEEIAGPAQDIEFVLAHADNIEASGFVSHLKLPHYVDFQAELDLLRRLRQEFHASRESAPEQP
ncbi:Alpha-D-ribose 1-methylphosphonate 5-triphosphate synthase subunit PhnI [compost metagenome]